MMGYWQGFPFWQTLGIAAGGMLGVMFSIPLRHVMVVQSELPYPEGVAAAEILRVGSAERAQEAQADAAPGKAAKPAATGMADIAAGGVVAAAVSFAARPAGAGRERERLVRAGRGGVPPAHGLFAGAAGRRLPDRHRGRPGHADRSA